MEKNFEKFSMQDAMRLAQSDTGRQLLTLLQAQNGGSLQTAMDQAAAGNYEELKKTMAVLLSSPEARALLGQLGRQNNG